MYSGAAVAEIAAGNLAYATNRYGISWYAPRLASAFHVQSTLPFMSTVALP